MLRTCAWRHLCSLPALMAMLFIAFGMPLVHPSLHGHDHDPPEHQCMIGAHAEAPCAHDTPGEEKASECPICDFLATVRLHYTGSNPVITIERSFDRVYPASPIDWAKDGQIPPKSRAPPPSPLA
jgi:hypothetical protein